MLTRALSCGCPAVEVLNPRARPRSSAAPAAEPPLASPLARPSRAALPGRRGGTALPEHPSPPPRRLRRASASLPAEKLCAQLRRAPRGAGTRSAHGSSGGNGAAAGGSPRAAPRFPAPPPTCSRRRSPQRTAHAHPHHHPPPPPGCLAGCGALLARSLRGRRRLRARGSSTGPPQPPRYRIPPIAARGSPRPARAAGRGRCRAGTPLRSSGPPSRSSSPGLLLLPPPLAPSEGTRFPARCPPAKSPPAPAAPLTIARCRLCLVPVPAAAGAEGALPALGWPQRGHRLTAGELRPPAARGNRHTCARGQVGSGIPAQP